MALERLLEHGAADCITENPLFCGVELQPGENGISERGQALMEIEFICRYWKQQRKRVNCVYTRCPKYLSLMSKLFPQVYFCAFSTPAMDYDPEQGEENTGENVDTMEGELKQDMASMIR